MTIYGRHYLCISTVLSAAQHMELHPEGLSEQQIVNWESPLVLFIFY